MYLHTHKHIHTCTRTCTYACTLTLLHAHTHTHIHEHSHACMHRHMHMHAHTCTSFQTEVLFPCWGDQKAVAQSSSVFSASPGLFQTVLPHVHVSSPQTFGPDPSKFTERPCCFAFPDCTVLSVLILCGTIVSCDAFLSLVTALQSVVLRTVSSSSLPNSLQSDRTPGHFRLLVPGLCIRCSLPLLAK